MKRSSPLKILWLAAFCIANVLSLTASAPVPIKMGETAFKVSGTVTDKNGEPLIGATIMEKGTSNGAFTDLDGKYAIEVADGNAVLVFSYTGSETVEIPVNNQAVVDVKLAEGTVLEEVIVVGYGIQKKSLS